MEIPKDVLHSITEMIRLFYKLRRQGKNPELEARIGRIVKTQSKRNRDGSEKSSKSVFQPGLGNNQSLIRKFNKSMAATRSSPTKQRWKHKKSMIFMESLFPNNIRSIVMPPQKNIPKGKSIKFTKWQEKIRVRIVDVVITNRLFDIRFALSVEKDLKLDDPKVKKCKTKKAERYKFITEVSSLITDCKVSEKESVAIRYDVRKIAEADCKKSLYDMPCVYHIEVELDNTNCQVSEECVDHVSKHMIMKACAALGNYEMKDGKRVSLPEPMMQLRIRATE